MSSETTLYTNHKTRTLVIIVSCIIVFGIIIIIYNFSKKPKQIAAPISKLPNNIVIAPGAKSSEKYIELQNSANLLGTQKADKEGKTFIPTLLPNNIENSNNFNKQLTSILKEKDNNPKDYEKLSKQLALLLLDLQKQGQEINNLLRLIRELQNQGYDVGDLEKLLAKLLANGYNVDELAKLLAQLKQQGYRINDLEDLLKKLLAQGFDQDLINKILSQLLQDRLKGLLNASNNGNVLEQIKALQDLLNQLKDRGYNIFDMNVLFQQLKQDGFDPSQLQDLYNKLRIMAGADLKSLQDLINALITQKQSLQPNLDDLLAKLKQQGADLDRLKSLIDQLKQAGLSMDDIMKLLNDLINQKLNPDDLYNALLKKLLAAQKQALEDLLAKLKQQGADLDRLKDLIDQLKQAGLSMEDIMKLLNDLVNKRVPPEGIYNELSGKLSQNRQQAATIIPDNNNRYEAIIKKQELKSPKKETSKTISSKPSTKIDLNLRKKQIDDLLKNMGTEINQIETTLSKTPLQSFVAGEVLPETPAANPVTPNTSNKYDQEQDVILKAGTILFAVIKTAVNSDEPGPILAEIVQGSLKGANILGSMQNISSNNAEGLSLTFKTINIKNRIRSYSINAVAIDPDTARTVLSSEVNHHYLLRWGSLFAATFLKGYSSAIAESGNSTSTSTSGTTTTTTTTQNPKTSTKQQIFQGLSDVGNAWSQNISQYSNIPNTIKINPGTSIGLLLTNDFTLPSSDLAPNVQQTQELPNTNTVSNNNLQPPLPTPAANNVTIEPTNNKKTENNNIPNNTEKT